MYLSSVTFFYLKALNRQRRVAKGQYEQVAHREEDVMETQGADETEGSTSASRVTSAGSDESDLTDLENKHFEYVL